MHARPSSVAESINRAGAYFVASLEGVGSVHTGEGWKTLEAGKACVLPAQRGDAFEVGRSEGWHVAWVRFPGSEGAAPMVGPHIGAYDGLLLMQAIEGLHAEVSAGRSEVAMAHHWVELIYGYVQRFVAPLHTDERVWRVWGMVEANLREPWTLEEIAATAQMSAENFRRLCLKVLGRSPMKHLTYLRMRMAAEMLTTTDDKVETVARSVGYDNPFAFSNAFLKWIGVRPSEHRAEGKRGD